MPSALNEKINGSLGGGAPYRQADTIVGFSHSGLPKIVNPCGNFRESVLSFTGNPRNNRLQPNETTRYPILVPSRLTLRLKLAPSLQFIAAYPAREYDKNFGEFLQGER
jgi:hypothetical protein